MMDTTFDDDHTDPADCERFWQAVLAQVITDALQGSKMAGDTQMTRVRQIQEARDYITQPNRDFNEVCYLAGMNPEAVRERLRTTIAEASAPEELAGGQRAPRCRARPKIAEHVR